MTVIKVCGITETTGLQAALALGVDRIGLMFAPNSPRLLAMEKAVELAEVIRGRAQIVAVAVNPGDKLVKRIVTNIKPDFLQLHGNENPKRVRSLWKQHRIPVIKAFAVSSAKDIADADRYSTTAAEYLFDARPQANADREGGLGIAFNWSLLEHVNPSRPFLLAGGLTPQNVAEAISKSGAKMVDVSSGVESSNGIKDEGLLQAFCAKVRSSDDQ
ncbi:MAG: phosphoribosylanthranilate isomerase [Robiginitomaculum sp.]|nr:phosphoribosylanthranilate isomerase [Robiginitomaculum sp.]